MSSLDQAAATQLSNIQAKTGKTLAELSALVRASGLTRHSEIRAMLMRDLGLGHGDANTLVHYVLQSAGASAPQAAGASEAEVIDALYTGPKAALRPIHDQLMAAMQSFGPFEIAPKKGYISLRRKKQFAMLGPATKTQVEVGLNVKGLETAGRLTEVPAGGMCNYKVRLSDLAEVDEQLIDWLRQAYDSAG